MIHGTSVYRPIGDVYSVGGGGTTICFPASNANQTQATNKGDNYPNHTVPTKYSVILTVRIQYKCIPAIF